LKILLDTHALLWLISGDERLTENAVGIFRDKENKLFFSAVGFWEICLKVSIGKLILADGWMEKVKNELWVNFIKWLPVEMNHCAELTKLPFHHRDPFDRMIIAQAITEKMKILSCDAIFSKYDVTCLW